MSKAILCLLVFATLCTIVAIVLSYVLAQQISCEIKLEVSGSENLVKNEAKYDILSLDLSKDDSSKWGVWSSLGFETFEILMMVLIVLFLMYKLEMRICGKDGILSKR